ncbi:MAG: diadenylate cyclase CdaA [Chloroherpetonaceae bacterium]|nr:diadenylate cyclase CdaA [Chloroherpetonaceae bacterium]
MIPFEFSNVELFNVLFIRFTLLDLADVLIVGFLFYKLYDYLRGTVAAQIFVGLILTLIASAISTFFNLTTLSWIFEKLASVWLIIVVILFQPEIRRFLLFLGQSRLFGRLFQGDNEDIVNIVTAAVSELSDKHYGALLVFVRNVGLKIYIETGEKMNAEMSKRLIASLFYPNTPLHDGAVIINGKKIEAARCVLPLTQNEMISGNFGMRHRAALGITEISDAFVIVISEETGRISIAENGKLTSGLSLPELKMKLAEAISPRTFRKNKRPPNEQAPPMTEIKKVPNYGTF